MGSVEAVSVEVIYTTSRDFQYATHPNWRRNEAFAPVLARAMEEVHPGLLNRVTAVHNRRYNQDLHPHMLLLEVGNYLDLEEHAIAAATLLGRRGGDGSRRDPLGPGSTKCWRPGRSRLLSRQGLSPSSRAAASLIPAARANRLPHVRQLRHAKDRPGPDRPGRRRRRRQRVDQLAAEGPRG